MLLLVPLLLLAPASAVRRQQPPLWLQVQPCRARLLSVAAWQVEAAVTCWWLHQLLVWLVLQLQQVWLPVQQQWAVQLLSQMPRLHLQWLWLVLLLGSLRSRWLLAAQLRWLLQQLGLSWHPPLAAWAEQIWRHHPSPVAVWRQELHEHQPWQVVHQSWRWQLQCQ